LKPQVYLPFNSLLLWLQLEIKRENYKLAEQVVKKYMAHTTNLIDEKTGAVISLNLRRKEGPVDPWEAKPEILDLQESEYYRLIDVYIFHILLPSKGYDATKDILMREIAMDKSKKREYINKLVDYYQNSVREVSMMHGTEAIDQLNKVKVKDQLKNMVEGIKNEPLQQGTNEDLEQDVNPLLQSTFSRTGQTSRSANQSTQESKFNGMLLKFKYHLSLKKLLHPSRVTSAFIALATVIFIVWMWRGGYHKLKKYQLIKFLMRQVFGL